ncbi:hypothetical protein MASR1M45_14840 [Candidatus Kapaibacterium sp.]
MNNSEYTYNKISETLYSIKLKKSVLGGNDALEFTNIVHHLIDNNVKYFVIDLFEVEIMNSAGIGMIANALSISQKHNLEMFLINVPDKILKLFGITHLDKVFKIYSNIDEVLSQIK